jgi:L,D-peptidoglycan transpeptidase YkuD (ErfK/YbiS/YcfS/YnhG family)
MRLRTLAVRVAALAALAACTAAPSGASGAVTATSRTAPTAPTLLRTAASPVDHYVGVGNARQLLVVQASGYGTSYATVTAYQKTSSGWVRHFGPWQARIGRNGFAAPGKKREGDGKSPTGSFGFSFFFGVNSPPSGLHYAWRHAYTYNVWDDDSASSHYNEWIDKRKQYPGHNPEPMHNVPSYNYAAVIAYNTARKPGLGSAIFFHVTHSSSTAGCVAISQSLVIKVLKWLNPTYAPRIIMGTKADITD